MEKTVDDRRDMFGGLDDVSAVTKNLAERTRIHARESFDRLKRNPLARVDLVKVKPFPALAP